ncbi:transporter substrate-binding domain-containing protein [Desulfobaculum sp.]
MRIRNIMYFPVKVTAFICLAVVAFSALVPPPAQAGETPHSIVVGGDLHYPPYEFLNDSGDPAGFNVDLTRALAKVTGMNITIRLGLWKNMREALAEGDIDVLQGISHSSARESTLSFSEPYTTVEYSIFARDDSPVATSLDDMEDAEVIVEEGGAMYDTLTQNYPRIRIIPAYNHENALRKLAAGHGDFALVSQTAGRYMVHSNDLDNIFPIGTPFSLQHYCYATRPDKAHLLATINAGLETLKKDGTYRELCNKWLSVPSPDALSWRTVMWYGAWILGPLLLILMGSLLWTHMLRHKVEERTNELREEARKNLEAKRELERKQKVIIHSDRMATLGVMASGVAHEINNPNGMMLMNLPVLADTYEDAAEVLDHYYDEHGDFLMGGLPYSRMRDEVPQMISDMLDGANRIKNIVRDLKDYSRKGERYEMEPLDFNHLVKASLRLVRNAMKKSSNAVTVTLAPDLPTVTGSSRRIQQVIINLVLNACQALPGKDHGIAITTGYDSTANAVILRVQDEGVGIPQEHLDNITDPFFTTKRESGGTGLGLSVSAGIVKEHFGALDFESTPGQGTTVTLSIPAAAENEAQLARRYTS